MGKKVLIYLLAGQALLAFPAAATYQKCEFVEGGHGYIKVSHGEEEFAYRVKTPGPNWVSQPQAWNATGSLSCDTCAHDSQAGGLYNLKTETDVRDRAARYGYQVPNNSSDRLARRKERFGYPYLPLRENSINPVGGQDDLRVGPLKGHAVKFKVHADWPKKYLPRMKIDYPLGLLAMTLSDGCVQFSTTILMRMDDHGDDWPVLSSLINEISIELVASSAIPPPKKGDIIILPSEEPSAPSGNDRDNK